MPIVNKYQYANDNPKGERYHKGMYKLLCKMTEIIKEDITIKEVIDKIHSIVHDKRMNPLSKVTKIKYYLGEIRQYKYE